MKSIKIQFFNAAIARAEKNKKLATSIQEQQQWAFHIKQLKKLLKNKKVRK